MLQFLNYNFYSDGDSLNSAPSLVNNITQTKLSNAIFDHFNITKNTQTPFTTAKPDQWDYDTIINADFNGNVDGGNVDFVLNQINSIKIKRREKGNFDWITLKEIPINTVEDLTFVFNDRLNANHIEYEYAFVPVLNLVEGNYIINSVLSKFNGVFIGDAETTYKMLCNVGYGAKTSNQRIGVFEPLGKQFPVYVANGTMNYESGSVTATLLDDEYEKTRSINREQIVKKANNFNSFLTNRRAKILKDWNGNIWLCVIVGSPQTSYRNGSGMGVPQINFDWTEIGESNNQKDLYNSGVIDTLG